MNKIVEEQLKRCLNIDLNKCKKDDNTYFIPQRKDINIEVNNQYLIEVNEQLKNPSNYININWNKSKAPQYNYYKVDVSKVMGKMIYVNGLAYDEINEIDLDEMWSGWVSKDLITIIEKL